MAKFPVTCTEYLDFLNAISAERPDEAARRVPRSAEKTGHYWPMNHDGKYVIPTEAWLATASEQHRKATRRLGESPVEWEDDWPVMGVSWDDAVSYAAWFTQTRRVLASLPGEVMWEKAARGADRRLHPFGNYLDYTFANAAWSHEGKSRPCPVDSFPTDESPCGVRGLCGNSSDWCIDQVDDGALRLLRGGAWFVTGYLTKSTTRYAFPPSSVEQNYGFRLCVLPSTAPG
jgi:formylglycine-generating enzyme required for sulfatase activity